MAGTACARASTRTSTRTTAVQQQHHHHHEPLQDTRPQSGLSIATAAAAAATGTGIGTGTASDSPTAATDSRSASHTLTSSPSPGRTVGGHDDDEPDTLGQCVRSPKGNPAPTPHLKETAQAGLHQPLRGPLALTPPWPAMPDETQPDGCESGDKGRHRQCNLTIDTAATVYFTDPFADQGARAVARASPAGARAPSPSGLSRQLSLLHDVNGSSTRRAQDGRWNSGDDTAPSPNQSLPQGSPRTGGELGGPHRPIWQPPLPIASAAGASHADRLLSHPLSAPVEPQRRRPFSLWLDGSGDGSQSGRDRKGLGQEGGFLPSSPFVSAPVSARGGAAGLGSIASAAGRPDRYRQARRSTEASSFLSQFSARPPDPPKPDDEGQVIFDDWVVGRKIGRGGFSTVKQAVRHQASAPASIAASARDTPLSSLAGLQAALPAATTDPAVSPPDAAPTGRRADVRAIKIVKRRIDHASDETNELVQLVLEHELGIWCHLNHPHIVPLDFVHQDDYATWFFMPFLSGGTLLDLIAQNRSGLGPKRARCCMRQLASALQYLHETVRVAHRDVKPENCLLVGADLARASAFPGSCTRPGHETNTDVNAAAEDGKRSRDGGRSDQAPMLMLTDFGMATWLDTDDDITSVAPYRSEATAEAQARVREALSQAGTMDYAAPEKLSDAACPVSTAADVWALGAVAYFSLVGAKPFHAPTETQLTQRILAGEWCAEAVLDAWPGEQRQCGQPALELLQRCLSLVPQARPTIGEIVRSTWLSEG
ncbi:hypothetical protein KEM52_000713 [Ascosphaera acerosa]|nr:hypothetical protein KEM52_000713 [Ascosphaera acerosa]